ncbi:hypothetical protein U9M48_016534 [Paspalum notatum var. saurae]|uniref:Uncharacterized protein n=1 Tax=Paspalum notatum var. saurae TaxID=547442 RepID=A0AAQ3T5W0_PASNO
MMEIALPNPTRHYRDSPHVARHSRAIPALLAPPPAVLYQTPAGFVRQSPSPLEAPPPHMCPHAAVDKRCRGRRAPPTCPTQPRPPRAAAADARTYARSVSTRAAASLAKTLSIGHEFVKTQIWDTVEP